MPDAPDVTYRPPKTRPLWFIVGLGGAGAVTAAARIAYGGMDGWAAAGLLLVLLGLACLYAVTVQVTADADGLHSRTLLRRRNVPWSDIADLRLYEQRGRHRTIHRVSVAQRDRRTWRLPLPTSTSTHSRTGFDAQLEALRALHHRYGAPESSYLSIISTRSAGRGSAVSLIVCVLLLAAGSLAAWFVPIADAEQHAWRAAVPCTATTPAAERAECLTTQSAVIARVKVGTGKQSSWLYFADSRPLDRLMVSSEGAEGFEPGDHVQLTVWRHEVRVVTGAHHVWRDHFAGAGSVAVVAALFVLAAGYPGAQVVLRRRGRRLPDDEVLPSALPFVGVLFGTALWLVPLCALHPTTLTSRVAISWAGAGSAATLGLCIWAWRATRVRAPERTGDTAGSGADMGSVANGRSVASGASAGKGDGKEVFVSARFLDPTDYNPNCFGTHIVLGGGDDPSVVPHSGPGRFAAKRIPVRRLAVKNVRRVRGDDGDTIPRRWHVAELDDAGEPVRLAAAPADLTRLISELGLVKAPVSATDAVNGAPSET